jgi:uncharacterized protein YceK
MKKILIYIGVFLLGYSGMGAVIEQRNAKEKVRSFPTHKSSGQNTTDDA